MAELVFVEGVAEESGNWAPLACNGGVVNADSDGEPAWGGVALLKINFSICAMLALFVCLTRAGRTALICFPNVNFFKARSCGLICSTSVSRSAPLRRVRSFSAPFVSEDYIGREIAVSRRGVRIT